MKAQSELARRAFGNGKANGGYVIIAVLVLMALLSVQSLFVWKIIKRMAGVLQVETAALSAESLARADVWQLLSSVDQEEFPLDSILNLRSDRATFVRTGSASVVMLNGRASYLGVKRRESVLVSIRSTSEEKPVLPNWGELFDNLKGASDVCTRWARATTGSKEGSENRSSRTCVGFASNLSQGGVIMGNLEGLEPVYVSDVHGETLRLVVVGDLDLQSDLIIERSHSMALEIIVAGNASLNSVVANGSSDVKVLLHSAFGKIYLRNMSAETIDCKTSQGGFLSIALEAGQGMRIGTEQALSLFKFGCPYERYKPFWKKFKIIGFV